MAEVLQPSTRLPSLFRRDESQRGDRHMYRLNTTLDEAMETTREAASQQRAKYSR